MDRRGEGGGGVSVQCLNDVVADQHRAAARLDSGGEGEQIAAFQLLKGAAVNCQPGVGVGVVAVAGEVLQDAAHAVLPGLGDHGGDEGQR